MKANAFTGDHIAAEATLGGTRTSSAGLLGWFNDFIARRRAELAARALRRQLAELDETLLRDIGIAEGEIWKIRQHRDPSLQGW